MPGAGVRPWGRRRRSADGGCGVRRPRAAAPDEGALKRIRWIGGTGCPRAGPGEGRAEGWAAHKLGQRMQAAGQGQAGVSPSRAPASSRLFARDPLEIRRPPAPRNGWAPSRIRSRSPGAHGGRRRARPVAKRVRDTRGVPTRRADGARQGPMAIFLGRSTGLAGPGWSRRSRPPKRDRVKAARARKRRGLTGRALACDGCRRAPGAQKTRSGDPSRAGPAAFRDVPRSPHGNGGPDPMRLALARRDVLRVPCSGGGPRDAPWRGGRDAEAGSPQLHAREDGLRLMVDGGTRTACTGRWTEIGTGGGGPHVRGVRIAAGAPIRGFASHTGPAMQQTRSFPRTVRTAPSPFAAAP
jgi:hypothetical protein